MFEQATRGTDYKAFVVDLRSSTSCFVFGSWNWRRYAAALPKKAAVDSEDGTVLDEACALP